MEQPNKIVLPSALRREICAYGQNQIDFEVCGLIGGIGELARSFYSVENISEQPRTSFFMDPQQQIDAMRQMRGKREQLLGIFHTHPHSRAEPSATDLDLAAYPGTIYLIQSLLPEENDTLSAFLYADGKFTQIMIEAA